MPFIKFWSYLASFLLLASCQDYSLTLSKGDGLGGKKQEYQFRITESITPITIPYGGGVKLLDGRILMIGGVSVLPSQQVARIFDPVQNKIILAGTFPLNVIYFSTTLLAGGKVLVTGGQHPTNYDISKEAALYDPQTNQWEVVGSMEIPRALGSFVSLPDGRALFVGGQIAGSATTEIAEFFDPSTKQWERTTDYPIKNYQSQAGVLNENQILVFGGNSNKSFYFDIENETWTETASLQSNRIASNSIVLSDGRILVLGGTSDGSTIMSAGEVFDPVGEVWTPIAPMRNSRVDFGITKIASKKYLICGGRISITETTDECEVFNEETLSWDHYFVSESARGYMKLYTLNDGRVFATGGLEGLNLTNAYSFINPSTFTTSTPLFLVGDKLDGQRIQLNENQILITGGNTTSSAIFNIKTKKWSSAGETSSARFFSHSFKLPNGEVLLTGGDMVGLGQHPIQTTEIFNPISKTWRLAGDMNETRNMSGSFSLDDGRVCVVGGGTNTMEIFDPVTGTWSYGDSPNTNGMIVLPSISKDLEGNVFLFVDDIQRFDIATETWSIVGKLSGARYQSKSIRLSDGRFLIMGGTLGAESLSSTEFFDPLTNTAEPGPSMTVARTEFTVTSLPDGKIMAIGGRDAFQTGAKLNSIEVFDPETETWVGYSINLSSGKSGHMTTLTDDGELFVWGG